MQSSAVQFCVESPVQSSAVQFCVEYSSGVQCSPVQSSFVLREAGSPVESSGVQFCVESSWQSSPVQWSPVLYQYVAQPQDIVRSSEVQWSPVEFSGIQWSPCGLCGGW